MTRRGPKSRTRRGLRVIAGEARGHRLVVPAGARPTTDRVRESLFGALGDAPEGAAVLDLYAGSGALAIEALSRGAERAVLVDRDGAAVVACRTNLAATRLEARARVQHSNVATFLRVGPPHEAPFDLVFVDAPYATDSDATGSDVSAPGGTALGELDGVLGSLAEPGWLSPCAAVVLERSTVGPSDVAAPGFEVTWERAYGDTLVTVLAVRPGGRSPMRHEA